MKVLLVANGQLDSLQQLEQLIHETDFWVAVDGGMRYFVALNHKPHIWVGDMDSYKSESEVPDWLTDVGRLTFNPEKDLSDTALAIEKVLNYCKSESLGLEQIILMGMLGGRLDHTLFNLSLLMQLHSAGIEAKIVGDSETIQGVGYPGETCRTIENAQGMIMSLYPYQNLEGISLEGFKYPLRNARMLQGDTLGLSNEIVAPKALVRVDKGCGILYVTSSKA